MISGLHTFIILITFLFFSLTVAAQSTGSNDSSVHWQKDLIDIARWIAGKNRSHRQDTVVIKKGVLYISAAPIVEYTIATGFSPGIAGNIAFNNGSIESTNTSSVLGAIKYTQKKQLLVPVQSILWSKGNHYNFLGDWRYLDYSQDTYGLGGYTAAAGKYSVTYKYLRVYESVLKRIGQNVYGGPGYQLDYHWQIKEVGVPPGTKTDFQRYGFHTRSVSSGISFALIYDSRKNSINPEGGSFFSKLQVTQNSTWSGSSNNWSSLVADVRRYLQLPHNYVLGFWYYSQFTIAGSPPYLDLPGTGTDTYNNTGRGYEQNRFTGKNMIYLETEFRFGISRNGLLGGVLFANAQSVTEPSGRFETVLPGMGAGLRIKFNKFSKTNACVDYGTGVRGSHGFTGNLGEVF